EVVLPYGVEYGIRIQYAVRVDHEVSQLLELGGGEVDEDAGAADLVGVVVELEVARHDDGVLLVLEAAGAAEDGADAGDDLFEAEGLGHIVIAADGQTGDLVRGVKIGRAHV